MTQDVSQAEGPSHEVGPSMVWGIKHSFRMYIASMGDARQAVEDGATLTDEGLYRFELAPDSGFDEGAPTNTLKFRGFVRFRAHFNMLVVQIEDPWITIESDSALLTIRDPFVDDDSGSRMPLATLALPKPVAAAMWEQVPAFLTKEGVALFNSVYAEGEALDSLDFSAA